MAIHRQLMMCRRLRLLRDRAGMTQCQVADVLEISQAAYSRLEKGEVEISLTKLIALGDLYQVSLQNLLEGV